MSKMTVPRLRLSCSKLNLSKTLFSNNIEYRNY